MKGDFQGDSFGMPGICLVLMAKKRRARFLPAPVSYFGFRAGSRQEPTQRRRRCGLRSQVKSSPSGFVSNIPIKASAIPSRVAAGVRHQIGSNVAILSGVGATRLPA